MIWTNRPAQGSLPLVVGVTGHRDIRRHDVRRLKREVDSVFRKLRTDFPHTPLIVLSPLAEGADRLVARVGLRRGATLIVPLPMPAEQFVADFATETSRREFRLLCDRAAAVYAVPFVDPQYRADAPLTGVVRDRRYAAAGAYIAVNSDVLIALWDGEKSGRLGGTSCIVEYKLSGVPEPFGTQPSQLDAVESGPVYHIVTPRQRCAEPTEKFAQKTLVPSGWDDVAKGEAFYQKIYRRIDKFNADSGKLRPEKVPGMTALAPAMRLFAIADALAQRYQRKAWRALNSIFWIVGASVLAFELFAHLFRKTPYLALDVFGFMTATLIFRLAKRAEYEVKYQDYRALAEGLRVQRYWRAAGIPDSVADHYLRKQRSELDWIRDSIRSSRVLSDAHASKAGAQDARDGLRVIYEDWILDQRDWFARRTTSEHGRALRYNDAATWTFVGGLALALIALAVLVVKDVELEGNRWVEVLVTIVALTAVVAGLLHNYSEKRAWSAHSKQYGRMRLVFAQAALKMEPLLEQPDRNGDAAQQLLRDLGKEALIENGDWLLLHRERPMDVPGG